MRRTILHAILTSLLLAGCSGIEVSYDYNLDARFSEYATWDWAPEEPDSVSPAGGVNEAMERSALLDRRIRRAVAWEMAAEGLERLEDAPDLLVMYRVRVRDRTEFTRWGQTYTGERMRGSEARNVNGYEFREGTLVVDLIDARRGRLAWRGIARGEVDNDTSPDAADERMAEVIHRMFGNYPPPD